MSANPKGPRIDYVPDPLHGKVAFFDPEREGAWIKADNAEDPRP